MRSRWARRPEAATSAIWERLIVRSSSGLATTNRGLAQREQARERLGFLAEGARVAGERDQLAVDRHVVAVGARGSAAGLEPPARRIGARRVQVARIGSS